MKTEDIIKVLKKDGLVIAPSDTVYGLITDATSDKAVEKLINFKSRPPGKAISVFVADLMMLEEYVEITDAQRSTIKQLLPGPFTIVLKSKHKVSKLLESESGTLGVRIPKYEFITELVKKFGKPLTATSANLSGRSPVYDVQSLLKTLSDKKKNLIDLVVDSGKLPRNKPSTVLDLTDSAIKTLREGDLQYKTSKKYLSNSAEETKEIAKKILKELVTRNSKFDKPIIFILKGELGAGKTVFVKGIGEQLGIKDIISPTFVIYYEYDKLIHVDLYNLEDPEEFKHLGLEKYLKPGKIFCIEWGEKSEPIIEQLKDKGEVIFINMNYLDQNKRELEVYS